MDKETNTGSPSFFHLFTVIHEVTLLCTFSDQSISTFRVRFELRGSIQRADGTVAAEQGSALEEHLENSRLLSDLIPTIAVTRLQHQA